ncbi:MAG: hypothetical protein CMH83_07380 [Nocardioides sp.]|nr:hypothetical protein [Nocardioides sp.]
MTDLEKAWDDLPVGEAPIHAVLAAARADAAGDDRADTPVDTAAAPADLHRRRLGRRLRVTAVAAGVAAAFVLGTLVGEDSTSSPQPPGAAAPAPGDATPVGFYGALEAPDDCDDLLAHYRREARDLVTAYGWVGANGYPLTAFMDGVARVDDLTAELAVPQAGADRTRSSAKTETATSSATGTNVQEAGVDEPDVVKTDGSLLVRVREQDLRLYDVTGDAVRETARLDLGLHVAELLLVGDTVVALGQGAGNSRTTVLTVDVSDTAAPVVTSRARYDAGVVAARQHGDTVRLVLRKDLPRLDFVTPDGDVGERTAERRNRALVAQTTIDDWLPHVRVGAGDPQQLVACPDVAVPRADLPLATMTVVGFRVSPDVAADGVAADDLRTLGLAGAAPLAYASTDHLYLATQEQAVDWWWGDPLGTPTLRTIQDRTAGTGVTHVYDFALGGAGTDGDDTADPAAATYVGAGEVEGGLRDRWSLDEADGVLRLALDPTSETGDFTSVVTLRAEKVGGRTELAEIGRLDGLGRRERLQSVRWFDGLALLVTFRQTDPLYAVDLTDVEEPTLLGELKIPGFSAYLHPLGGRRVVGIGEGPRPGSGGSWRGWGGQAGLFDVTDLTDPRRLDVVHYGRGSSTRAGDDPRQVTWLPQQRLLLTVVEKRGRAGYVSALRLGGGEMANTMTQVEYGRDVADVRTVPLPDGRVALVTGEDVTFFRLP